MKLLGEVVDSLMEKPADLPVAVVVRREVGPFEAGTVLEWDESLKAFCDENNCVDGWRVVAGWGEEFGPLWEWRESALVPGAFGYAYIAPVPMAVIQGRCLYE